MGSSNGSGLLANEKSGDIKSLRAALMEKLERLILETENYVENYLEKKIIEWKALDQFLLTNKMIDKILSKPRFGQVSNKTAEALDAILRERKSVEANFDLIYEKRIPAIELGHIFTESLVDQLNLLVEAMPTLATLDDCEEFANLMFPITDWIKTAEDSGMNSLVEEWNNLQLVPRIKFLYWELQGLLLPFHKCST